MSKDGGPAFPVTGIQAATSVFNNGLSLRDYFAAAALQGLCACPDAVTFDAAHISAMSYARADAMLAEREKS